MTEPLPVTDPRALLTELRARVLEREGIPMFLALQSPPATPATPASARPVTVGEGAELAELLRHYRAVLAPESADDAEPALIDVLQIMGAAHFDPRSGKETSQ